MPVDPVVGARIEFIAKMEKKPDAAKGEPLEFTAAVELILFLDRDRGTRLERHYQS